MQLRAIPFSNSLPRHIFEQIEQELGVDTLPKVFKRLESQPALLTHLWGQFHALVLQGDLPRVLKEMVGLVVATAAHCDHLCAMLLHSLTEQQAEQQTLAAIVRGDYELAEVSHATLAVLRFTEMAVIHRRAGATPANQQWESLQHQTRQALHDTGLEEGEQLELVATIALFEQLCLVTNLL
ncbi:MAG: carboxymuconolactone decarboxylase family protein [Lyngbya sp. HA4199-MV5]|nr:carboxymuconolactone decarboxylase family protein [Lyngbya sp. HA4199-MV5]